MVVAEESTDVVCLSEMKDGDIAVIVDWDGRESYVGLVIQRLIYDGVTYEDRVILLGKDTGQSFSSVKTWTHIENFTVKILKPGALLRI